MRLVKQAVARRLLSAFETRKKGDARQDREVVFLVEMDKRLQQPKKPKPQRRAGR